MREEHECISCLKVFNNFCDFLSEKRFLFLFLQFVLTSMQLLMFFLFSPSDVVFVIFVRQTEKTVFASNLGGILISMPENLDFSIY